MFKFGRLIAVKGAVAIMIAALLSLAFQPVLASTMASPQCAHAPTTIAIQAAINHDYETDQSACCTDDETSDQHECGNFCATSCTGSTAADMPFSTASIAAPSHSQHEADIKRPLLQFDIAFIPPPPRT
ncbi:MAG: hypothetical protein GXP06_07280 [Alphaproteobacteria bacterium]|nr:hypothetical protein [Alphaproteobacteria bacterium]